MENGKHSNIVGLFPKGMSRRQALKTGAGIFIVGGLNTSFLRYANAATPAIISEAIHLGMYVSLYTARQKKLFEKHGLDIGIKSAGGVALPVPVLLSGKGQFGVTAAGMSVNANLSGGKMKNIAKIVGGVAMWAVAKPDSTIKDVEDFKGKTIATLKFPSSTIQTPTFTMKKYGGFEPKSAGVKFLQLPFGAQTAAVHDGRADMATVFEWDASISKKQFGLKVVYSFADVIGPLSWTTAFVTEEYMNKNPEAIQGFCNAIAEAQKMLHQDLEVFVEVSKAEFPKLDESVIRNATANFFGSKIVVPRNPTISEAEWLTDMELEYAGGAIKGKLPYAEMVENSFAEKATKKYGLAS